LELRQALLGPRFASAVLARRRRSRAGGGRRVQRGAGGRTARHDIRAAAAKHLPPFGVVPAEDALALRLAAISSRE
jgi:hypothetical protein